MNLRTLAMLVSCATVLVTASSCGGKLGEDPEDEELGSRKNDGTGGKANGAGEGQAGAETSGIASSSRRLEACKQGFLHEEQPSEPCPYITDDQRCYTTWQAACDCACPREGAGEIQCVQFPATADRTEVFCQTI
jgi:hypothetical protein